MGSLTTYWFKEDEEFQEREPVLIYDEIDFNSYVTNSKTFWAVEAFSALFIITIPVSAGSRPPSTILAPESALLMFSMVSVGLVGAPQGGESVQKPHYTISANISAN